MWTFIDPLTAESLDSILVANDYSDMGCVYMKDVAVDTLPEESNVLHAANVLVRRLGWEKYGVVVNQDLYRGPWGESGNIFISAYDPGDFIESFEIFRINEINIYMYLGDLESYLRFMIVAHDKRIAVVE